eukprot:GHVP01062300.1.p1 GENE.GHVP01062300.1~~GHVP01062300.1.p1  ORF type:complete len:172 (-),score=19.75 GHVP01062300.1:351-806(-)
MHQNYHKNQFLSIKYINIIVIYSNKYKMHQNYHKNQFLSIEYITYSVIRYKMFYFEFTVLEKHKEDFEEIQVMLRNNGDRSMPELLWEEKQIGEFRPKPDILQEVPLQNMKKQKYVPIVKEKGPPVVWLGKKSSSYKVRKIRMKCLKICQE